ncbi:hypothetical protein [Sorangium sp. So ce131]|uniref:hypothetical protein n=1 Tax=Sorangium sp. So ce131 TaxID=3133282 RepID=UPI003F5D953F
MRRVLIGSFVFAAGHLRIRFDDDGFDDFPDPANERDLCDPAVDRGLRDGRRRRPAWRRGVLGDGDARGHRV